MPRAALEMVGGKARQAYRDDFEYSASKSVVTRNGNIWIVGTKGSIALAPIDIDDDYCDLTVTLVPAVVISTKSGFTVKVSVEGASTTINWKKGSRVPKQVQLPVTKEIWHKGAKISFKANSVGMGGGRVAPENIGLSVSITAIGAAVPGE
jgi:hypothetical protein